MAFHRLNPTARVPQVLLFLGLLAGVPARGQSCAEFTDLGTFGGADSGATAVSADGRVVVGHAEDASGRSRAFRWTAAGGLQDLGTPGSDASAEGVSGDGAVVVGWYTTGTGTFHAFRWTAASGVQDLQLPGSTDSVALALSEDGSAILGRHWDAQLPGDSVFHWTAAAGAQLLCFSTSGFMCEANDLSANGVVAVGWLGGGFGSSAWCWTAATGLQTLLNNASAEAISADGVHVAGSYLAAPLQPPARPFLWSAATGLVDLGDLGGLSGEALGVAADGAVVVGTSQLASGVERAFRWTPGGGMRDVGTLGGPSSRAVDVSSTGNVIVGSSDDTNGNTRAFRVELSARGETYCRPAAPNSTGCAGLLDVTGDDHVAANDIRLTARLLPSHAAGYFLASLAPDRIVHPGTSQGTLCLGGAIGRFVGPGQVQNSGATGTFTLALDLGALPSPSGPVVAQPGDTWHFQCWHRDVNPTVTSNFTDAVSVLLR